MKLKAFTILELTVITLLSAIVVGIAYTAYGIIYRQYINYQKSASVNMAMSTLNYRIQKDILQSDSLVSVDQGFTCYHKSAQTNYILTNGAIVRLHNAVNDTFNFDIKKLDLAFEKTPIAIPGILVDEVSFDANYHNKVLPFRFLKQYSTADLINKTVVK